jgi:3-hydroxyisobutyrate dehydrogenase-like beta-hydroxyacid dehydrogenase
MSRKVAVLGLGEAGSRYAADLVAAGVPVAGYDPDPHAGRELAAGREAPGLRRAATPAEAVTGAGIVLSLTSPAAAVPVARDAAAGLATGLATGAVYADLNTTGPATKRAVAAALAATPARFVDVAVLAPVPRAGLRTPLLLAGPGREPLAAFLAPLGVPVEDAGGEIGAAAGAKLLRSVFMKGLAAVIGEALEAAEAAGQREWLRRQVLAELAAADAALVDRLLTGSVRHAARRAAELAAAVAHLEELGARTHLSRATRARLAELAADSNRERV